MSGLNIFFKSKYVKVEGFNMSIAEHTMVEEFIESTNSIPILCRRYDITIDFISYNVYKSVIGDYIFIPTSHNNNNPDLVITHMDLIQKYLKMQGISE